MRLDKLTLKAQEAVQAAQTGAESLNHAQLEPEHLLDALLIQDEGIIPSMLRKLGASADAGGNGATRRAGWSGFEAFFKNAFFDKRRHSGPPRIASLAPLLTRRGKSSQTTFNLRTRTPASLKSRKELSFSGYSAL